MKTIEVDVFDRGSVLAALDELDKFTADLQEKGKQICLALASIGATVASLRFARAVYTSEPMVNISVEEIDGGYKILAQGEDVCFIEFGSGAAYGYGYPPDVHLEPSMPYGPGTWSDSEMGKGHWQDEDGWWYMGADGKFVHTYGNPPAMAMYEAGKSMRQDLERIARKVFAEND